MYVNAKDVVLKNLLKSEITPITHIYLKLLPEPLQPPPNVKENILTKANGSTTVLGFCPGVIVVG